MNLEEIDDLEDRVQAAAAQFNAAAAALTRIASDFEATEEWLDWGYHSCAQWLTIMAGLDMPAAREVLRVGAALRTLPRLAAAFASGSLSLDKLRAVTRVATPPDEEVWLEVAQAASGSQLARICREYGRALPASGKDGGLAKRGLWYREGPEGLVAITMLLMPEEAEVVIAAVDKVRLRQARQAEAAAPLPAQSSDGWAACDADAMVEACRQVLAAPDTSDAEESDAAPPRVVVHVDMAVLSGEDAGGRCHGRFRLAAEAARGLGCDCEVQVQTERDGVPLDLGRARRVVSAPLARALRARDGGCRFPGCGRRKTDAHHLTHWALGGRTDLENLLSLCKFHHVRLHQGFFRVRGTPRRTRFETSAGKLIGPQPPRSAELPLQPAPGMAVALDRGRPFDFRYAIGITEHAVNYARAHAP